MAKLTGTNKQIADEIRAVMKKHGVDIRSYMVKTGVGGEFSISMKCQDTNAKGTDGQTTSPQREAYKKYAAVYGYKPEWLGIEFYRNGRAFIFEGFNMGKPKNFISMIEMSTNRRFMTSEDGIKEQLAAASLKRPA